MSSDPHEMWAVLLSPLSEKNFVSSFWQWPHVSMDFSTVQNKIPFVQMISIFPLAESDEEPIFNGSHRHCSPAGQLDRTQLMTLLCDPYSNVGSTLFTNQ